MTWAVTNPIYRRAADRAGAVVLRRDRWAARPRRCAAIALARRTRADSDGHGRAVDPRQPRAPRGPPGLRAGARRPRQPVRGAGHVRRRRSQLGGVAPPSRLSADRPMRRLDPAARAARRAGRPAVVSASLVIGPEVSTHVVPVTDLRADRRRQRPAARHATSARCWWSSTPSTRRPARRDGDSARCRHRRRVPANCLASDAAGEPRRQLTNSPSNQTVTVRRTEKMLFSVSVMITSIV